MIVSHYNGAPPLHSQPPARSSWRSRQPAGHCGTVGGTSAGSFAGAQYHDTCLTAHDSKARLAGGAAQEASRKRRAQTG